MKGKSLNNRRQVQSDFLKRVEKLCGQVVAEHENLNLIAYVNVFGELPKYVNRSHYRSLSKEVRKPVKYSNKAK